jgi:hypothetical protein
MPALQPQGNLGQTGRPWDVMEADVYGATPRSGYGPSGISPEPLQINSKL